MLQATLIKIGGAELKRGPVLDQLAGVLARLVSRGPLVVVHGGGSDIADLQRRLGLKPRFVDGLRVTDEDSMQVAEMVLSGTVNKRLTARLVMEGVRAIGLSGVDGGLLRAVKLVHPQGDLGRVGQIHAVDVSCLRDLIAAGYTPVVSPISLGMDGAAFNVNADHAALAIARALGVAEMIFLTDVPGVMQDGSVLPALGADEAERLIATGVVTGGMIPKVRSALEVLQADIGTVRITNLAGLSQGTGTWISA
ncbi:MAG: acetylglutamate kinase [Chloroflexi bacterium]|nr:acetylglutamate kinase [Chloroflexota bacterium]